ncbi:MAG: putative ABC transporter permease subunit [Planctomycetota bacterium]
MYEVILLKYRFLALKNYLKDLIKNNRVKFFFSIIFFVVIFMVIYRFFKLTYAFFQKFENLQFDVWFSNTMLNGIFFFNLLFITISSSILSYNLMYKNKDTILLFFSKVPLRAIFLEIFVRTSFLSSWSFLVLSLPLLLVQFEQYKISLYSSTLYISFILIGLFLILPNVIGIFIGLFLPIVFTARSFIKIILLVVAIAGISYLPYISSLGVSWSSSYSEIWIAQTLKKFAFLEHPLLPSYWITTTLNNFFAGKFKDDTIYLLVTTTLVSVVWGYIIFKKFHKSMLMLSMQHISEVNIIIEGIVGIIRKFISLISPKKKYLFLKDTVTFLRDGRFWGQLLLFVGIFIVYFMNLSTEKAEDKTKWFWRSTFEWKHLILHLNIISTAFMSSAMAGRGLFPQFSIEYSKLWINQFNKHNLESIVHLKLNTIGTFIILICMGLVITSSTILKAKIEDVLYALFQCVIMTYTISNMALKLGVLFHNKSTDNPVIVFSGPGGVIYIMCGTLYIVVNAVLMLKIGLFTNEKLLWIIIFSGENIVINNLLNKLTKKVYEKLEYF